MKVFTEMIEGHNALVYAYRATADMSFRFHMLCEVGEPWQPEAKELLHTLCTTRKSHVVAVELDVHPWYVETLVKDKIEHRQVHRGGQTQP